jgi:hypothetical protein
LCAALLPSTASAAHIVGNNNANTLTGTSSNDWIEGLGGNDIIYGLDNSGLERLQGGSGADKIYGGRGSNDEITGGNGNDKLYGGCNGACAAGWATFFGGDGDDIIGADNGSYNDEVHCGPGSHDTTWVDAIDEAWTDCEFIYVNGDPQFATCFALCDPPPTDTGEFDALKFRP